jgi:hypothetical protein
MLLIHSGIVSTPSAVPPKPVDATKPSPVFDKLPQLVILSIRY